jgi:hypothetical protein
MPKIGGRSLSKVDMIRIALRWIIGSVLIAMICGNVWTFNQDVASLPLRSSDDVVAQEMRYSGIREKLIEFHYRGGEIRYTSTRDLKGEPPTPDDDKNWDQAQYVMVPWILVRNNRSVSNVEVHPTTPFVIADFSEGELDELPKELVKLYENSDGKLALFRTSSQ